MRLNFAAATLAALTAAVTAFSVVPGSAEAGEVLDRLRSHGLGKWVDKYVEEDKTGKVRYKRAEQDKWSSDYYDSKSGKWTGKKDGYSKDEADKKADLNNKMLKKKTASLKSTKTSGTAKSAVLTTGKRKRYVKSVTEKPMDAPLASEPAVVEPKLAPSTVQESPSGEPSQKSGADNVPSTPLGPARLSEFYGPPAPGESIVLN